MSNTVVKHRQYPLVADVPIMTIANIGAGLGYDVVLPPGAYVREVYADTLVAFDGTTNTITISDGTTTFVNAQDVKSTGRETAAVPGKYYPNGGTISITMAQTGSATVGQVKPTIEYVILGRVNEVAP